MENLEEKMKKWAPLVLRIGMSLVFLWFGTQQIFHTDAWTSLIPNWVLSLSHMSASTLVHFNGAFEIVFGLCLLVGYCMRVTSLLLALHMLHIAIAVGYSSIAVRDFGLCMATISIFLTGPDSACYDTFWRKKRNML